MNDIIKQLSKQLCLPESVIRNTYLAYWTFIRDTIESMKFPQGITEEQFNNMRTSFNIPNIGKLYCSYKRYKNIYNRKKFIYEAKHKKDKTNV